MLPLEKVSCYNDQTVLHVYKLNPKKNLEQCHFLLQMMLLFTPVYNVLMIPHFGFIQCVILNSDDQALLVDNDAAALAPVTRIFNILFFKGRIRELLEVKTY